MDTQSARRFEFNQLKNGNWNVVDCNGSRVLIAANVSIEVAEKAADKRRSVTQSAILTEQDFRDAMSKQCGFPLQLKDTPPESERQILRCAPPFDAQAEHENDLSYESRVDYESLQYDGPEEIE